VSGTTQVAIPEQTGLLVAPGDPDGLRDAMARLLAAPSAARAMGVAGRARVEEAFGARKQAEEHVALYRQQIRLVHSAGGRSGGTDLPTAEVSGHRR
jgi:glycosyltransferase involved in cell wall biosynthesis